jgi:hypothetical protein
VKGSRDWRGLVAKPLNGVRTSFQTRGGFNESLSASFTNCKQMRTNIRIERCLRKNHIFESSISAHVRAVDVCTSDARPY